MHLEVVPLLHVMRELYAVPRGPARFEKYISTITHDREDVNLLPLVAMNPMAKEHVNAKVDELIAMNAEDEVRAACLEAQERLPPLERSFKVGLSVLDDVAGGWTQRELLEAGSLLQRDVTRRQGWEGPRWREWRSWISVGLWAGDSHDPDRVRRESLAAVFRAVHAETVGLPETLGDMLRREGAAMKFAGLTRALDPEDLAYTREVLAPHRASTHFPTIFAAMFGDDAARRVGFAPLGLSERAGFALALTEAP